MKLLRWQALNWLNHKQFTHISISLFWFLAPENLLWKELFGLENANINYFYSFYFPDNDIYF